MNDCLAKLTLTHEGTDDPLKADFRNFVWFAYTEILHFSPPADLIYAIADYMQNAPLSEDDVSRGQIQCQRGAGKSVLVSIFCAWLYYCNPNIKVAVICSTQEFSRRMVKFVRSLFDGHELLRDLVPRKAQDNILDDFRKDQLDNEDQFVTGARTQRDPDPSCRAFGITATFTGIHPDIIISDDVETPENSMTVLKRERIHEKCREFESLIMPGGMVLFLGTPQTIDSLYIKYLDHRYVIRRWPAKYPDLNQPKLCENIAPDLLKKLKMGVVSPGEPTYPERFNIEQLLVKEAIEGPTMFALQFLLDPTLADMDRFPLKLRDLIVMDVAMDMAPTKVLWGTTNPLGYDHAGLDRDKIHGPVFVDKNWIEFSSSVMYVDPAGTGKDEVSFAIVKHIDGMLYCPLVGGFGGDGTSDAVMTKLAKICWEYDVQNVVVEKNFGDGMYAKLLQPVIAQYCHGVGVEQIHSSGQKEKRILDILGPVTRQHRLVVDPDVIRNHKLCEQFTHLTDEKGCLAHEDQVEALAGACAYFSEAVSLDPAVQEAKHRTNEKEKLSIEFQQAWMRQQKLGRSISIGSMMSLEDQRKYTNRIGRLGARRGTAGWTRA